jgi:chromatin segregation and condensation protein Rec8/ScpA/Scc1 (kleisin family)
LSFEQLLPEASAAVNVPAGPALKQRAAWTSTFIASLELAKQGEVALAQADRFAAIHVSQAEPGRTVAGAPRPR